jgi:hypothetical protein
MPKYVFSVLIAILLVATCGTVWASDGVARRTTLEEVREHIRESGYSWRAGQTPISRMSPEDFRNLLGLEVPDDYYRRLERIRDEDPVPAPQDLPPRFDWTDSSGVSPVRQQLCGDCWAQAAVAMVESKMRIDDGDITRLAVQQAIDCNYTGSSCNGGWWGDVYDVYRVVGAVTQSCYPYQGEDGSCTADSCEVVTRVDGWTEIDTSLVSIKTHLMSHGPIAVGFTVHDDFGSYTGGCYEYEGSGTVNHGILIVGWDDTKCGGKGAWHIKNSWGTWWGENGYGWVKYGTCEVGTAAAIVYYTPREPVLLVHHAATVNDSAGDGDGLADAGETITLETALENRRWETATNVSATVVTSTPGVNVLTGAATFQDIGPDGVGQSDPPHFVFSLDGDVPCGTRIRFIMSIVSDQGSSTATFDVVAGEAETVFFDDAQIDLGWSTAAADDDATAGVWKRKNPVGTLADSILVQSELDHTPGPGMRCFVTGNILRQLAPDSRDVDGGKTTLTTPLIDLTDYDSAELRYYRWYTNDTQGPQDDVWTVDVSNDSGATWVNLETKTDSERGWALMEYDLKDYVALSERMLVRFVASDYGAESLVEAAVDDVEVMGCPQDLSGVSDPDPAREPGSVQFVGSRENPFTGSTHIFFGLPERSEITVRIYDASGRLARELLHGVRSQGYHSVFWDGRSGSGRSVAPGMYFAVLESGNTRHTAKMLLLR